MMSVSYITVLEELNTRRQKVLGRRWPPGVAACLAGDDGTVPCYLGTRSGPGNAANGCTVAEALAAAVRLGESGGEARPW